MAEDRSEMEAARLAGLAKRHETREARAVRKAVAEECAQAIERLYGIGGEDCACGECSVLKLAIDRVREIGSRDHA